MTSELTRSTTSLARTNLLVMMQTLDVVLGQQLALRRLLGAIVLHALGKILHARR
jgi:hypothetical protein